MTLLRRTFLNTAAVAVVASLPGCMAMAPAAASICKAAPYLPRYEADSDAALNRLGQEFDHLHAEYLPVNKLALERGVVLASALAARRAQSCAPISIEEYSAIQDDCGLTEPNERASALARQLDKLTEQIRALPATTPNGFYVKVRAASFDCGMSHVFEGQDPDEMDFDIKCFFQLLQDARHFAESYGHASRSAVQS